MIKEETGEMTLIQNTLNGNPQAQEIFYSKYRKIVKDYLRHKFPKFITDIDDCVSEILIKVFYNLDKYDSEKSSVKTWILNIAKHYMIDTWRANPSITLTSSFSAGNITVNNASGLLLNTGVAESGMVCTATASNNLTFTSNCTYTTSNNMEFENCNSVSYISSQISPSDFSLLNMKYVQGYEYCEIGKEFNLTSSTISNRVNYIKTKLKKNNLEFVCD